MLTRLDLRFFKCFELLRLPLAPLTLLTGLNASGKSSVLQALVLLHQTMREHEWSTRLVLNGASVRLGTMPDVVDEVSGRRSFEIGLEDNENAYHWVFEGDRQDMSMEVQACLSQWPRNQAAPGVALPTAPGCAGICCTADPSVAGPDVHYRGTDRAPGGLCTRRPTRRERRRRPRRARGECAALGTR